MLRLFACLALGLFAFPVMNANAASCSIKCDDGSSCSINSPETPPLESADPLLKSLNADELWYTTVDHGADGSVTKVSEELFATGRAIIAELSGATLSKPEKKLVQSLIDALKLGDSSLIGEAIERIRASTLGGRFGAVMMKVTCTCSASAPWGRQAKCSY
jgi:hypothetical protein